MTRLSMNRSRILTVCLAAMLVGGSAALTAAPARAAGPGFAEFDRRAREGDTLRVVFFGASLTWGANATDQALTSYRAQTREMLEARYPKARFQCYDAAIGGTQSQLGVFRLERDVLARLLSIIVGARPQSNSSRNSQVVLFNSFQHMG